MSSRQGIPVTALLTLPAFAIAGYHPFAEDGGVYVAGIRKLLDPALYPTCTAFVTEHLRFSLFAPAVAALVRLTHLSLESVLFALYLVSIWATLYAGWMVIARVTPHLIERIGAVALFACWLTLPIAGTSLMLMDPYLTARSLTTPLTLAALAWALAARPAGSSRTATETGDPRLASETWVRLLPSAAALLIAALLHPLMAGYGLSAVLLLACSTSRSASIRRDGPRTLLACALLAAIAVQLKAPPESAAYLQIVHTRYYWFPFAWRWYEQLGLLAPLLLVHWLTLPQRASKPAQHLARAAIPLGVIALLIATLFAREGLHTHLVARLQPLRAFQLVYEPMILLLGAWLGRTLLQRHVWEWALTLTAMAAVLFTAQRATYPNSAPIEWPWAKPRNPWEQAFLWARDHTQKDALFALDAHYITEGRHEDAQCFRAIAQRSALPDYSKDGGEASITPALTDSWQAGQTAQTNLDTVSDTDRLQRLAPLGVTWIILQTPSPTMWTCPYSNTTVKVCQLPPEP